MQGVDISNNGRMAIANGSRDCTPVDTSLGSPVDLQRTFAAKTFKFGYVDLNHILNSPDSGFRDTSHVGFAIGSYNLASPLFAATTHDSLPLGTCIARRAQGVDGNLVSSVSPVSPLDAGSTFTIKGPGGSMTATANPFDRITLSTTTLFLTS